MTAAKIEQMKRVNRGTTAKPASAAVATHWARQKGQTSSSPIALRTPLPHALAPGATALVPVAIEAPDDPGRHRFTLDVVHERHRWFECGVDLELEVRPRRRALVLVGQPPGDASFDGRVDEALAALDPALEPLLVGPKPDWLRDRFGVPAADDVPREPAETVVALAAGRRRDRMRLEWRARRLRRHARR